MIEAQRPGEPSGDGAAPARPPAPVERRAPGRPRDTDLDGRILDATLLLLSDRGFDSTTMDDVAQAAGVAKATVYRRYASKDELAVDAVRRIFDREVPTPDTGTFRGDLEQVYADMLAFGTSEQGRALLRLAVIESCRDSRVAELYAAWVTDREAACQEVFDRAVARGELRPDAPRTVLFEWIPALMVFRTVVGHQAPLDPADAGRLVDLTLRGVGP